MSSDYPTRRPMGRFRDEGVGQVRGFPAAAAQIPWIDPHGHHHTLTWREHEEFEVTGCAALVMAGGLANEAPYRPMTADDVRAGWDWTIRLSHTLSRNHAFDAYAAVGVHTSLGPVRGLDTLYDRLPAYAALDEVVAISETGVSMIQEHDHVPLPDQRAIVREQLRVAADTGLPAVLHTPTLIKGDAEYATVSNEAHDHGAPVLDPGTAKLDAARIDVELATEVGLPEDRLVLTHAHRSLAPWVLEHTDCFVSFTVGNATRDVTSRDVAAAIDEYGADRIMLDSDSAGHKEMAPFAVKRTILDLLQLGIDPATVRTVAYDNPRELLGLDTLPA